MWSIKVPASSANLGPGFDSYGIALNKFLTVQAAPADAWTIQYETEFLKVLPNDEKSFVIKVAQQVALKFNQKLQPLHLVMASEIPLTHGLGSSASAIVAGIEIANHFAALNLSEYQKVQLASEIEGHPDNVGACITGGLFVGYYHDGTLYYETARLDNVGVIVSTPHYELATKASRAVLPAQYTKVAAIQQNALSSVMLMALMNGHYEQMGQLMMQDKFHEPYRQALIQEFPAIKQIALSLGAYATVISGAGPSVLTLAPVDKVASIVSQLQAQVVCHHEAIDVWYN